MFCYNCGKEIDDKAVVCIGCGVPVTAKDDKANDPVNGKAAAASGGGIMAMGIVSLCLSGFAAIMSFFTGKNSVLLIVLGLFGFLFLTAGLVLGIIVFVIGRKGKYRGLCTAAFVVSIVLTGLYILAVIVGIAFLGILMVLAASMA